MDSEAIKEIVYNALRPYYIPIGQNQLWKIVEDTFYEFKDPNPELTILRIPHKLERQLVESKRFSKPTFVKALIELVEENRIYRYDDKDTKRGGKWLFARVNYDELRDIIGTRLDFMLKIYQDQITSVLNKFKNFDTYQRAKIVWDLHLLLFTAEHQIKLYSEIFPDELDKESLLNKINEMRNSIDKKCRQRDVSKYRELIQDSTYIVTGTAVSCQDRIKKQSEFSKQM